MSEIITMFATFVAFVGGVIAITELVNRLFKIENETWKLIMSWILSFGLAALGFCLQLGLFADLGDPHTWQGWVKTFFVAIGCAFAANKTYDTNEIWKLIQIIFSFFSPNGAAVRAKFREEREAKKRLNQ